MAADTWTWVAPDASETTLVTLRGKRGVFMPNYDLTAQRLPDGSASYLQFVGMQPRAVDLPIQITAASHDALRTSVRALAKVLHARNGDGYLKVTRSGIARKLTCRYTGGLEQASYFSDRALEAVLSFEAADPLWYATTNQTGSYSQAVASGGWFPFFPLRLITSAVFKNVTVTNPGDVEAWPIWTITGPGATLILKNLTSGLELGLDINLAASEQIVIDTRPLIKTIVNGAGDNLYALLRSGQKSLWPLLAGDNNVQILLNNATGASLVDLAYTPSYLSG